MRDEGWRLKAEPRYQVEVRRNSTSLIFHPSSESDWNQYLATLTDDGLEKVFEYTSYEGQRFRNSIGDILTQLFAHSSYHRGQIAALVRTMGGEPAVTDFVYWAREPI
jgi:uncharacterized damage-inducible protein DinB